MQSARQRGFTQLPRWLFCALTLLALAGFFATAQQAQPADPSPGQEARPAQASAQASGPTPLVPAAIRICSFNTYNLKSEDSTRQIKSEVSRAATAAVLSEIKADIILLSELGPDPALAELNAELARRGLHYPFASLVNGPDRERRIGILSRFPPVKVEHKLNVPYNINGTLHSVSRGFACLTFEWQNAYRLHLIGAHLKSKLPHPLGQNDMRRYEARQLHYLVDEIMKNEPQANILVMGDMNDSYDSSPVKEIQYRRYPDEKQLYDLRPGDSKSATWTYYHQDSDNYSRIDYFFASYHLLPELNMRETFIHSSPHWFIASDHRPIVTTITPAQSLDYSNFKLFTNATRRIDTPNYETPEQFQGDRKLPPKASKKTP